MKKTLIKIGMIFTLSLLISSCTQVTPNEAGFRINKSGNYRGINSIPLVSGYQFYNPMFTQIVTMPTTQQHVVWTKSGDEGGDKNQEITIACQGGAGFSLDVGFNYRIDPVMASQIYLKYKTGNLQTITDTYLRNKVRGAMQDISSTLTVDSILNNLSAFEHAVRDNLTIGLAKEGFIVDNFNFTSKPRPTDATLANSINAKITARQDAETAKMQLQTTIAEANKSIAEAEGDSASQVIKAEGEAEAVKRIQTVLTPVYVDYIKWKNASENVPRVPGVIGGTGGMMLNLKQ